MFESDRKQGFVRPRQEVINGHAGQKSRETLRPGPQNGSHRWTTEDDVQMPPHLLLEEAPAQIPRIYQSQSFNLFIKQNQAVKNY